MRKFLYGIVTTVTVLVVLLGGGLAYIAHQSSGLDRESKAYVDEAVTAIVTNWDSAQLTRRAAPEFLSATTPEQLHDLFGLFEKLGPLVDYRGSSGDTKTLARLDSGTVISATYVARGKFANGEASIQLQLVKRDDGWKILGFHVNTPLPNGPAQRSS